MTNLTEDAKKIRALLRQGAKTYRELKDSLSDWDEMRLGKAVRELRSKEAVTTNMPLLVDATKIRRVDATFMVVGNPIKEDILETIPADGITYEALRKKLNRHHEGQLTVTLFQLEAEGEVFITPKNMLNDQSVIERLTNEDKLPSFKLRRKTA